jgi:death on curing protein
LAATYAFHISKNHPFVDGNKRVALQCCLGFLLLNGVELTADGADLYEVTIRLVTNEIDKQVFAAFLRSNSNVV